MKNMSKFESYSGFLTWFMALLLVALVAGCGGGGGGGGRDPILGTGGNAVAAPTPPTPPTVTAVAPLDNAVGVGINNTIITAAFSEPMDPATLTAATFTVTCTIICAKAPTGTVALDATNRIATFTLTNSPLLPLTTYTATVTTGAKSLATGLGLASPFPWHFTTAVVPDTTRPTVKLTVPATPVAPATTTGVPTNTKTITAVFTEEMNPATIQTPATNFTLTCVAPCPAPTGTVSYVVGSGIAVFTLTSGDLAANTEYTATIIGVGATPATDLAGNALAGNLPPALPAASNYQWKFTTLAKDIIAPVVSSTSPANGATNVDVNLLTISATFDEAMDPLPFLAASTFTLTGPTAATSVAGTFTYNAANNIVTMNINPLKLPLAFGTTYTATITNAAKDVAGNALVVPTVVPLVPPAVPNPWTFTTAAAPVVPPPVVPVVDLGAATTFAIAAQAGVTNTASATTINGDVVLDPVAGAICNTVAVDNAGGFGVCGGGLLKPTINGLVISPLFPTVATPLFPLGAGTSARVMADLKAAYFSIAPANQGGTLLGATSLGCVTIGTGGGAGAGPGCAGHDVLAPGVYIALNDSIGVTGVLTLDGQNLPNPRFIFQTKTASTLTTAAGALGAPGSVIKLINGATASNVFWQVGSSATIGLYSNFQGNVLANTSITMGTGATSCGRLLAGAVTNTGAFVFDNNVVSVPGNGCPP